jgi:hypothetical protein
MQFENLPLQPDSTHIYSGARMHAARHQNYPAEQRGALFGRIILMLPVKFLRVIFALWSNLKK